MAFSANAKYLGGGVACHDNILNTTLEENTERSSQKPSAQKRAPPRKLLFPSYSSQDLTETCFSLCIDESQELVWEASTMFFEESENLDMEVHTSSKTITGTLYKTPEYSTFLACVGVLEESEQSVFELRGLNGDSFVLAGLWQEMKIYFAREKDFKIVNDEMEDEDESEDDSEDESNVEVTGLTPELNKNIIQLECDADLMRVMVDEFEVNYLENKNHSMSTLAHASSSKENRVYMLNENWGKKMLELIFRQLEVDKDKIDARLIRNTCILLKNLLADMEIVPETLERIVNAVTKVMVEWCPKADKEKNIVGLLRSSQQVLVEADQIFVKLASTCSVEDIKAIIGTRLDSDENINEFLANTPLEFESEILNE